MQETKSEKKMAKVRRKPLIFLSPHLPPIRRKPLMFQETENSASETDIPLKLPRAMRSAASNGGNLLRERNVDQAEESVNKVVSVLPQSSPARSKRASEEKENCNH